MYTIEIKLNLDPLEIHGDKLSEYYQILRDFLEEENGYTYISDNLYLISESKNGAVEPILLMQKLSKKYPLIYKIIEKCTLSRVAERVDLIPAIESVNKKYMEVSF